MRRAIDDAEAVARSRGGDLDAFGVLVARYTLRAHRAAFLLGAGEEADDVVQEAFVKAFAGVELRQEPGPVRSPGSSASLPGERRMPLEQARHQASFPLLVPAALGRPTEVAVSDRGRVASLIYRRTPYGQLRMDEFAGHLDPVFFQKFVHFGNVTEVEVNGAKGLWIKGPHVLMYITRDGTPAAASARLTTGNTLIWGTRQVALRLEGNLGKTAALAIASSAG